MMKKYLRFIPLGMCALYGFYPLTQALGSWLKFAYELRSLSVSAALTVLLSIAATIILLKERPEYGRIGRAGLILMLPLCSIYTVTMVIDAESIFAVVMAAVSFVSGCILFFSQNFQKWYTRLAAFIAVFPITALTSLFLLLGGVMVDFDNVELLRSYERDGYICYDYRADSGALGVDWYTDVYSKERVPMIFGTFYPHYERILSFDPL